MLDGGSGTNTADYGASSAGVTIQLELMTGGYYSHYTNFGTGSGGDAGGDTLVSIQNVIGSNGDDRLVGDYHDNILSGGIRQRHAHRRRRQRHAQWRSRR